MDKEEQIVRFNNNLMTPIVDVGIWKLPTSFAVLGFFMHLRLPSSIIAPSHTLALYIRIIEINCIVFLFTKLLLPNVVYSYYWSADIKHEIQLPHLNIETYKILQLSKLLTMKTFYQEYRDLLDVDLEKE